MACVVFWCDRDHLALFEANMVAAKAPEKLAAERKNGDHVSA
jgi:hypothetical protein